MATKENTVELLNDLIRINNDRIVGYTKAIEELKDEDNDIRTVFQAFIVTSRKNISELTEQVLNKGGEPAHDSTAAGKIYHAWMDVKATFTGHDLQSILNACEFGEDAAQKAYKLASEDKEAGFSEVAELIARQKNVLLKEHDAVKKFRDTLKAVK